MKVQRPGLVVAIAILLCLPMAPGIIDGGISPAAALVRFLAALLLCWAGGAIVSHVLRRYTEQSRRAEVTRMVDEARRRAMEQAQQRAAERRGESPPGVPGSPRMPGPPLAS